jgi:membrane-associated phospholipid phosphatase
VLYALFPVDGPSHTMARYAGPLTDGFFYRLSTNAVHAGDSLGTAFPSSHVVGAVSMAILAARWLPRRVALVFAMEGVGVVLSTVYTQNHFAIDSAVGVLLALGVQLIAVPALESTLRERRLELPVPPLPVYVAAQPDRARR